MKSLCALFLSFFISTSQPHAVPPNIVVLLADDHSAADMSVYGAADIPTPHLERMAAAGMVFERAYVNSPSCAPSRAALFTGMFPAKNGAEANHSRPGEQIKRLPAYLKELGYEVVSFGKTSHYAHVSEQGFDLVQGFKYHDHTCVQASMDFLKKRKNEKPLALFFGTHWPHVPLPAEPEGVDPARVRVQPMHIDTPEFRYYRARYITAVKKMDEEIGTVYEAAKAVLGTENTFFLQTSDHGAQLPFGKWNLYEEGTRVPLIVHWQGKIMAGTRTKAMVQWIDILPTLIEVGGGTATSSLDGKSFLPVLTGATQKHRDAIFATHSGDGNFNVYPCRSIRDSRWKYIRNLHPDYRHSTHIDRSADRKMYWESWEKAAKRDPKAAAIVNRYRQRPAEELYDLESDPFELNNLAAEEAAQLAQMRRRLEAWMKSTGDTQQTFGEPLLLSHKFSILENSKKKQSLRLNPNTNLEGDAAPSIVNRPFTLRIEISRPGTRGVLAAHGGQTHGWALFIREGELHFIITRNNQHDSLTAKIEPAKCIEASIGPKGIARLSLDGKEVAQKPFSGLLTSQPIDGLQISRDLAAPVGDYPAPFAFDGVISTANLEIGDEVPAPPSSPLARKP